VKVLVAVAESTLGASGRCAGRWALSTARSSGGWREMLAGTV